MIARLSLRTGIAPSVLWAEDTVDIVTMLDEIRQEAEERKKQERNKRRRGR